MAKILFAYHRHRGLDASQRPSPWHADLPSLYRTLFPEEVACHFFDDDVNAGHDVDEGFVQACLEAAPDLVIYYPIQNPEAAELQPSCEALRVVCKEKRIPVFAYLGDAWFLDEAKEVQARDWSRCCDRLIVCEPRSPWITAPWAEGKILPFWFARDPAIFRPFDSERVIDVSFPGSVEQYPERKALLEDLGDRGIAVSQCGGVSDGVFVGIEELASFFARSYIALNFTSVPGLPGVKPIRGRVWESVLSGCLLFEEEGSSTELFFTPGEHYVAYSDMDELCEKLGYYLAHRSEGERIARAGRQRACKFYSPEEATKRLFRALEEVVH